MNREEKEDQRRKECAGEPIDRRSREKKRSDTPEESDDGRARGESRRRNEISIEISSENEEVGNKEGRSRRLKFTHLENSRNYRIMPWDM